MSENQFEAAILVLQKSQDSKGILNALIYIRKELDWPKNRNNVVRLRERGGLKQIVGILSSSPHKTSVDVALSILGNCLMDRSCTSEVVAQHSVMSVLTQLLKKYPKEDSINGRIFRIIGNMCQHRDQWSSIIIDRKPLMVSHTVEIIKRASKDELPEGEKISDATVITALRALRELLNCHTVMALVKQFGVLKAIGALFIKYSNEWQTTKQNEKMVLDVVRVIQEYSRYRYYHSILEMRNTDRGDSLIHLSSILILAPKRIVKIVMNFIRSCQLKSELPIPEICSKFVEVLEKHSIVKELGSNCVEYLQCLCYLLDHPANRNKERCDKVIPLLIKVLKEFEEPSNTVIECCTLLTHTLNKFKYDNTLMLDQLKHGIIQVLIDKLSWIVGPPGVLNLKHVSEGPKKRKFAWEPRSPVLTKRKSFGGSNDVLKECLRTSKDSDEEILDDWYLKRFRNNERSPSPCSSSDGDSINALSWSEPESSPSRSLVNESDSDNYSPVCSEVDESEFPPVDDHGMDDSGDPLAPIPDLDESFDNDMEEEPTSPELKSTLEENLKEGLRLEIVRLLKSYINLKPPVLHLANVDLLMQLTKCSISQRFYATDVICDILDSHEYLIPLMQTSFIQTVYDIYGGSWGGNSVLNHEGCPKCATYSRIASAILGKFTEVAESGCGKGDIAHQLLRGDTEIKQKLVLVIPYIIRDRSILGKLMLNCGGLEILMKLLRENDEQDNRRSIKILCEMASRRLRIANPSDVLGAQGCQLDRPKIVADKYKPPESCNNVVSFILDDSSVVKADREFLTDKSDFFNSLLNGHFKESGETEIALPNVDSKSFRCLLHLLTKIEKTETIDIELDLETLLDVIMLSDRYLLVSLCSSLTDSVEALRINTDTVPVIYNWSISSGTNLLRIESVAFALVANVDDKKRYNMFEHLFNLGYKEELLDDIQKLLVRYLAQSDFNEKIRTLCSKRKNMKDKMRDRLLKSYV